MDKLYVQFGCGLCAPYGWRNFDASPRLRIEKNPFIKYFIRHPLFPSKCEFGDIVKGLPLAPESCDVLYSSHVLEHLSLSELRVALNNAYVLLKPGGVFRAVVPDLEVAARKYIESGEADRANLFLKATSLGKVKRVKNLFGFFREMIGNSAHLWMWDYVGLEAELRDVGFVNIRRASFGDTNDEMIGRVENSDRWQDAVGVHCIKP